MAETILFDWMRDGRVPILDYVGEFQYLGGGWHGQHKDELEWRSGHSRQRAWIPIIDSTYDGFIEFLTQQPLPEGQCLYVGVRSSHILLPLDDQGQQTKYQRFLLVAVAIFPEALAGAVERPWRFEGIDQIKRFLTLHEEPEAPEDPYFRTQWDQIVASREQSRKEMAAFSAAWDRSKKLLQSHLDEDQAAELKEHGRFRVTGPDGHRYLFLMETHGNIYRIKEDGCGNILLKCGYTNFCIVPHADVDIPLYDQLLGQKLLLETDPEAFFSIANAKVISPEIPHTGDTCLDGPRPPSIPKVPVVDPAILAEIGDGEATVTLCGGGEGANPGYDMWEDEQAEAEGADLQDMDEPIPEVPIPFLEVPAAIDVMNQVQAMMVGTDLAPADRDPRVGRMDAEEAINQATRSAYDNLYVDDMDPTYAMMDPSIVDFASVMKRKLLNTKAVEEVPFLPLVIGNDTILSFEGTPQPSAPSSLSCSAGMP